MTTTNETLHRALDDDDAAFLRSLDNEPGLMTQFADSFHGSMKFWTGFAFVMSFVVFGLAIFCAYQLWLADTAREYAMWGLGAWFCLNGVGMLKMWMWMRMNHLATLREIKRLELQMVRQGAA